MAGRRMMLRIADIAWLFDDAGTRLYGGEAVTQAEHALQTAWAAEVQGAADPLIVAALLHDLGHMLFEQPDDDLRSGRDDRHQRRVLPFLGDLFDDAVLQPIALHVEAKRYLCHAEPAYLARLSPASRMSLALQGGVMDAAQAEAFLALPHAADAIALRRWDDAAKVVGLKTPPFMHHRHRLDAVALCRSR